MNGISLHDGNYGDGIWLKDAWIAGGLLARQLTERVTGGSMLTLALSAN